MRTPPTTAPTTVPVLTEPSLPAGVVSVVVNDNILLVGLGDNIGVVPDTVGVTRVWLLCCVVDNINVVTVDLVTIVEDGNDIDDNNLTIDGPVVAVCCTEE